MIDFLGFCVCVCGQSQDECHPEFETLFSIEDKMRKKEKKEKKEGTKEQRERREKNSPQRIYST